MLMDAFNDYVSSYDFNDENILLKYNHSVRVMELMRKYAILLNFNEDDVKLAEIIGLLHDIGRFEQLKVYHTYVDSKSVDHADYSVRQLFEKGEIKLFTDRKDWYPIIEFAIKNHNKNMILECSDERTIRLTKLIRDVDKLDIMYLLGVLGELNNKMKDLPISLEVRECVFKHKTVDTKLAQNLNDRLIVQLAFVFDINNDIILNEYENYFDAYVKQLEVPKKFNDIVLEIKKYIKERILLYERN